MGSLWLHLRICLECGHVGCCDDSPNRHATAHARASEHPLIRTLEPGEDWTVLGSENDPYMNQLREEWRQGGKDSGKDGAEVAMIIGTGRMANYLQPRGR